MNLLEYQAKTLLHDYGLPVPRSWLVRPGSSVPEGVSYPVIAKSQVPVGGRGKAGGILPIASFADAAPIISKLSKLSIKGHVPSAVLLEEKIETKRELYLSLQINRDSRQIEWLVAAEGGVNIEENADQIHLFAASDQAAYRSMSRILAVDEVTMAAFCEGLKQCFLGNDLLLLEINPLIEQTSGKLICADAKCMVDDNARFRHPELPWPPAEGNVPQPLGGTIGCIANGAGMAMSTMDTIVAAGGKPANFLDIGGGTGEKEFVTALKQVMELPSVTSIIVNIFAGISRCDEIARGIIAAREQLPDLPPLFIRLEGTNRDIAIELLTAAGITTEPNLKTCVEKAMEATS